MILGLWQHSITKTCDSTDLTPVKFSHAMTIFNSILLLYCLSRSVPFWREGEEGCELSLTLPYWQGLTSTADTRGEQSVHRQMSRTGKETGWMCHGHESFITVSSTQMLIKLISGKWHATCLFSGGPHNKLSSASGKVCHDKLLKSTERWMHDCPVVAFLEYR